MTKGYAKVRKVRSPGAKVTPVRSSYHLTHEPETKTKAARQRVNVADTTLLERILEERPDIVQDRCDGEFTAIHSGDCDRTGCTCTPVILHHGAMA